MPSPDIRNYVDLTVYDLQPTDIYDASVEYAATAVPEWTPVPGSVEDALLQAASLMTGELVGAINRLPSGVVEALLKLYGVERIAGTAPTGTVIFTLTTFNGATVPVGTRIGHFDSTGDEPVLFVFETTAAAAAPVGENVVEAPVMGLTSTRYPALMAGESLQLLSALSFVDGVVLEGDLDAGANPESDIDYIGRATAVFGQLSEAIALPQQMDNYTLLTYPAVYRSKSYSRVKSFRTITSLNRSSNVVTATFATPTDLVLGDRIRVTDADESFVGTFLVGGTDGVDVYWSQVASNASSSAPGVAHSYKFQNDFRDESTEEYVLQNGYVTVYASAIGGASATSGVLDAAQTDLAGKVVAGLILKVDHAVVAPIGVDVTITKTRTVAASVVQQAVRDAIAEYAHPDYWPWEERVYRNELIALIDRVPGVDRVVDVTMTSTNDLTFVSETTGDLGFRYFGVLPLAQTIVTVEI
jgi:hypothetical protein